VGNSLCGTCLFGSIGPPPSNLQAPSLVWQWQWPSPDVAAQLEVPHHILDIVDGGASLGQTLSGQGAQSGGRNKTLSD